MNYSEFLRISSLPLEAPKKDKPRARRANCPQLRKLHEMEKLAARAAR